MPIVAHPFLSLSVEAFDQISVGAFAGSLFGVLALVAVPVLMLGAVSPWAIRLKLERVEDSGEIAGRACTRSRRSARWSARSSRRCC